VQKNIQKNSGFWNNGVIGNRGLNMDKYESFVKAEYNNHGVGYLPKEELMKTLNKINFENVVKECWYEFLNAVYKNENFVRLFAYINPSTASIKIKSIHKHNLKTYSLPLIELYSISYDEIRNIQGGSLIQSRFYIDRYLNRMKSEGYFEQCRETVREKIDGMFQGMI
jgi:hypothetical protein